MPTLLRGKVRTVKVGIPGRSMREGMLVASTPSFRRIERFLLQYDQTAQLTFVNKRSKLQDPAVWRFVGLAHRSLGFRDESPMEIYRELSYVWGAMKRRKKGWHGKIELAPADVEGYW